MSRRQIVKDADGHPIPGALPVHTDRGHPIPGVRREGRRGFVATFWIDGVEYHTPGRHTPQEADRARYALARTILGDRDHFRYPKGGYRAMEW